MLMVSRFLNNNVGFPLISYQSFDDPKSSRSKTIKLPSLRLKLVNCPLGSLNQTSISACDSCGQDIVIKNSDIGSILPLSAIGFIIKNASKSKLVKPTNKLNNKSTKARFELYFLIFCIQ